MEGTDRRSVKGGGSKRWRAEIADRSKQQKPGPGVGTGLKNRVPHYLNHTQIPRKLIFPDWPVVVTPGRYVELVTNAFAGQNTGHLAI